MVEIKDFSFEDKDTIIKALIDSLNWHTNKENELLKEIEQLKRKLDIVHHMYGA